MTQNLLLVVCFLIAIFGARGQNFSLSASFSNAQGSTSQDIAPALAVKNNSSKPLELRWEIDRTNLPSGWDIQVCDKTCHIVEGKSLSFSLAPHETLGNFRVVFSPNGQEGIGSVEIQLYENGHRSQSEQTLNFTASAQNHFQSKTSPQRVFPNPAIEYIMVEDDENVVRMIEIFNVVGRKIEEFPVSVNGQKYDIASLPRGIYMVRMLDANKNIVRTQRISKYNP